MTEQKVSRREIWWLAAAVVFSMIIHGLFVIHGFGEQDACQLGRQAAVWAERGELRDVMYTVRTSPMYLCCLKMMLDAGIARADIPAVMNWSNVICGSMLLIPLYLIWRRLSSPRVVAIGLLIYSLTPVFWLSNLYGMPHVPAMLFFISGLLLFAISLENNGWREWVFAGAAAILGVAAIGIKADVVLCYGAFLLFAVWRRPVRPANVLVALAIPALGVLATTRLTDLISSNYYSVTEYRAQFPVTIRAITDVENAAVPVMAVGIVLFVVMGLCTICSALARKHLRVLGLILLWSAPALLFWCSKPGNNARHLMVAFAPLTLLVASVFAGQTKRPRLYLVVLTVILVANYFVSPSFSLPRTGRPSSRLLKAHKYVQARVDSWHNAGKAFAMLPDARKELFGADYSVYGAWEVFAGAKSFGGGKGVWQVTDMEGHQQSVKFVYVAAGAAVPPPEAGWSAYLWKDDGLRSSITKLDGSAAP